MTSRAMPTGGELEGSSAAFDELVSFISGEIADGMLCEEQISALATLCYRIDPTCQDWLGM